MPSITAAEPAVAPNQRWAVLGVIALAQLVVALDATIVDVEAVVHGFATATAGAAVTPLLGAVLVMTLLRPVTPPAT